MKSYSNLLPQHREHLAHSGPTSASTTNEQSSISFALYYASRNMAVFPVHFVCEDGSCSCEDPECNNVGKHPMTHDGFKSASCEVDQVRYFFTGEPEANIGVRTGAASGIVVVDIDPRHDGDSSLQALIQEYGALPPTPTVSTGGGGWHLYFRHPGQSVANRANLVRGIDIRGDGGYVLGAGSNHVIGDYTFAPGLSPDEVPLAILPQWLLKMLLTKSPSVLSTSAGGPILNGQRNDTLFRLACSMQHKGMSGEAIAAALRADNLARCTPPLPENEIADIVTSAAKYRKGSGSSTNGCPSPMFDRGDETEVAFALLERLATTTGAVYDEGGFWQYSAETGLWIAVPEDVISRHVQDLAGSNVATEKGSRDLKVSAKMVRGARELAAGRACRRGFFDEAQAGFAFANGFVRVDAAGIHIGPHSPNHRARASYPFAFDPKARAPRFEQFLDEVFAGDADAAEKKMLLQEFTGASLTGRATRQAKAIVTVGEGRNGKSTLQEIISAIFPAECRESIPPQNWEQEYYRERLKGKLLNTVAELPKADILRSEAFKAIIAGDTITARAIRRSPIQFKPIAGHILAANTLPAIDDCSKAFWARILVVTFNNEFSEQKGNVDRDLARTIIYKELPGLATWALEGAARLLAQGSGASYTVPAGHHAALAEWRLRADQVAEFLAEKTEPTTDPSKRTSGLALYAAYTTWAEVNGHRVMASNKFGERVKALGVRHVKPKDQRLYDVVLKDDIRRMSQFQREHAAYPPDPVIPRHSAPVLPCGPAVPSLAEANLPHPPGPPGSPDVSLRNVAPLRPVPARSA